MFFLHEKYKIHFRRLFYLSIGPRHKRQSNYASRTKPMQSGMFPERAVCQSDDALRSLYKVPKLDSQIS